MMKFNHKELAELSFGEATIEGRLHHKKTSGGYSHSVFKERWFKLRANILFYFNLSETGQVFEKKPVGAYILENVIVKYEMKSEVPFSFSLHFNNDLDKKHLFSGRTQENINRWVDALKQASYEYWRSQLLILQKKLEMITGQDPLLMYPRNEGCKHAFEENSEIINQTNSKTKVQSSTFQFHISVEDSIDCDKKLEKFPFNNISGQQVNLENNDNKNSINVTPPMRPARGNKLKQDVQCGNLIDI